MSIFKYLDLANLLTLINIIISPISIYFAFHGYYLVSISLLFSTTIIDNLDGYIARKFFHSNKNNRKFGMNLDSFADLLNFCFTPIILILFMTDGNLIMMVIGIIYLSSGVLRLAKFNTLENVSGYIGLPTTYSGFILFNLLLFYSKGYLNNTYLLILMIIISILQVVDVQIKKPNSILVTILFIIIFTVNFIYTTKL